ncbi:MAG: Signal peptidase I [Candidatus Nomurabacteria bacterium GW2011_GWC2_35_35]|nr:MAG: Signal peptidase I [Candidatus Nomurabacteria bacterium GW2011_GWC2_35_35]
MEEEKSNKQSFWELARFALMAIAIVVPIRIFIAQPFIVSGSSMVISYRLNDPKRNDVVVFRYPNDQEKFFIKRIIGLPNETVDIKGDVVIIFNTEYPSGFILDQSYVKNTIDNNVRYELKNNEYFVMGDNRSASSDSRYYCQ